VFTLNQKGNVRFYTIDSFSKSGCVHHCFTTRHGGVSSGCYESMNLRYNCDDLKSNVDKNFEIICDALKIDKNNLVLSNQVHEDKIVNVGKGDCGNGILYENKFKSADGLITDEPKVALVTFYADCVPIFFLDPVKKVIALTHSGWKGTVKRIGAKTVEKFVSDYHCERKNIIAAIGPSIHLCHFEVGEEVAEEFLKEFGEESVKMFGEKPHVDLQKSVFNTLTQSGINPENITQSGICTYCNWEDLFSHRKTMGKRGNLAAIMELK